MGNNNLYSKTGNFMSNTHDLTEGNVTKQLLTFTVPVMLGALFQQFYNIVDTAIVGRTLGVDALAAVGATGSIMFMILGLCNGVCAGCAIPMAQRFGAKDEHGLRKSVANSVWLGIMLAVVLTAVTVALCHNILDWMNTPANVIDKSYAYLIVIFFGIPVTIFYNMLASIIRALGDSKTPLYFLIFSSLLNIALDYLFILVFHMGTEGAGLATVLSQLVAAILCLVLMIGKYTILHMTKDEWHFDWSEIGRLASIGFPMGLQYSITAIGSVLLQTSVNGLGSDFVAAQTSGGKISVFAVCPLDSLGTALATFTGQNIGAKKLDRIDEGLKSSLIIGTIYSVVLFGVMFIAGDKFALIFVEPEKTAIIANIHKFLIANSSAYVLLLGVDVFRFMIQGMGFSYLAIISGVMEMIARGIMGIFFVSKLGFIAACFASPLAWVLADMFLIPAYIVLRKKVRVGLAYE